MIALEEGDEAPMHSGPEPRRLVDLLDGSGFCLSCQLSLSICVENKQIPVQSCRPDRTKNSNMGLWIGRTSGATVDGTRSVMRVDFFRQCGLLASGKVQTLVAC